MAFIDKYERLRSALRLDQQFPEDVVSDFLGEMDRVQSFTQGQRDQLDQQCLDQYQDELSEEGANGISNLGETIFPFLAIHLNDLANGTGIPTLTRFHYQSGKITRGSELEFLRNTFLERLFSFNDLPLRFRRWFFDQVVRKSAGLPTDAPLIRESMTVRMVILAQRHARNIKPTRKEAKEIRRLVERNDLLTQSLLREWGLRPSWFDGKAIKEWFERWATRGNLRRAKLILGKQTLLFFVVLLYIALAWTLYAQWQLLMSERDQLAQANKDRWEQVAQWLTKGTKQ